MGRAAFHYRFGYDGDYVSMTCRDRILRNYLRGGRAVKNYVVINLINSGLFNSTAEQGSLVPLRAYWVATVRSSQLNLNVVKLKAGGNYVHAIVVGVTARHWRLENDFVTGEYVLLFKEMAKDLIHYAPVVNCRIPPSGRRQRIDKLLW